MTPSSSVLHEPSYLTTVAHRGKTQLNFSSETTVFSRTQQSFQESNNVFENTTTFSRTQQNFPEH